MPEAIEQKSAEHDRVYESYRRWGYLAADLDPLGFLAPVEHPELIRDGPAAAAARKFTVARLAPNSCISTIPSAAAGLPIEWNRTHLNPTAPISWSG